MSTEITILTKNGGPLTKRISLRADGTANSDGSACLMANGEARRMPIADVGQLAALIEKLPSDQAITLGRLHARLPNEVRITTKSKLLDGVARPDLIARTGNDIIYAEGQPAFALIDHDCKGMPPEVAGELLISSLWEVLVSILPTLANTARVMRASTSTGLRRTDTSEPLPRSGGLHGYLSVKDGADIPRFLRALHDRCWLTGYGWYMVGAGGQLLERSIVDRMVGGPERLIFEGAPICVAPVEQDAESRRPIVVDGDVLDTLEACPPLTIAEKARLAEIKAKASHKLAPEAAKARDEFIAKQAKRMAERTGMSAQDARRTIERQTEGMLLPDIELSFDDEAFAGCTVGDVLSNPERFVGETLADPIEGVSYGRCKAKIMRRAGGTPWIHSFAHGRTIYELKLDAKSVRAAIVRADRNEAAAKFVKLATQADLREDETESLRDLAAERAGIGKRTVARMLKQARLEQASERKHEERKQRLAERNDPRPLIEAPELDAPWLPQMASINNVLTNRSPARPQSRDVDCDLIRVTKLAIPIMHGFGNDGANASTGKSSLLNPEQWVIKKMNEMEAAEMIERHIDYFDNDGRSVHLPTPFVRHFMRRDDGALPTVAAVATLPVVLADGELLMTDGLDRHHSIWFEIQKEIRAAIPWPKSCTADALRKAMRFLCDEWLVDVATDFAGKCTIIAAALSILERCLLPDRPAFFVIAGRRGGGKTTVISMLVKAVTGTSPAASAWSINEEERRKALLSYLLYGVSYIVWDNIPRGSQISCPHIEKSCTAAYYSDRKLGVSEMSTAAASAIYFFTGNNVGPKGDLASRSLCIRLTVDRHDPENRDFKHPDPIGWTDQHRGEILTALYAILLGNPMLKAPRDAAGKTRFKMWWRLIGSAVEHAAQLTGQLIDFKKLFLDQEQDDEETIDLATALDVTNNQWPTTFKADDVANFINIDQDPHSATLREFLFGKTPPGFNASAKAVGRRLKNHVDAPVPHGDHTLTLRARTTRTNQYDYFVDVTAQG